MTLRAARTLLAVWFLALPAPAAATPVLDQEQLVYNGGTSARTLPGYTIWQSFTAGLSGTLVQIDMGFFNDMSGTGVLRIRAGEGTAGAVLQTLPVTVVGVTQPGVTWNLWPVSVPVSSGSVYTFELTPDAATLPDPYGVAIGAINPYPGGVMGIDDPSGSYPTEFDVVFRTFVGEDDPDVYRSVSPVGLIALPNLVATSVVPPWDDPAPPPAQVQFYAVSDGAGSPDTIRMVKRAVVALRIEWN